TEFQYVGQTTIRSGAELRVDTERESVALTLTEMDKGSWGIFDLPGFKKASAGKEQKSLAALLDSRVTSYYMVVDTLWVQLVVEESAGPSGFGPLAPRTVIDVSK